jgi:hypothetical protein
MRSTKSVAKEAGTALLPAKEAGIQEPGDCPAKINGFRASEVASRQHVPSSRCLRPFREPRASTAQRVLGGGDLLNLAALLAMRNGGRAYAVPRERIPRQVPATATLRF